MNADGWMLTTSVAVTVVVIAVYTLLTEWLFRTPERIDQRLKDELGVDDSVPGGQSLFKRLSAQGTGDERSWRTRLEHFIEQSALPLTLPRLLQISGGAALLAGMLTSLLAPHWALSLPAATAGFALPFLFVQYKRRQRIDRLTNQLPEAFELMSRSVRAGQTMASALKLVATECKPPIADEFALCCQHQDLGLPQEVALRDLSQRNGVTELEMFVVAMLVQRQTGGSPVEILNNLSGMVRKRIRMKGKVKALTGEGRMQAVVLSILPVVAFAAIYFLKRSYAEILLDRPLVLVGIVASTAIGGLWIRRIVNIDY